MCDVFDQKDYVGVVNVSYMAASSLPHIKVRGQYAAPAPAPIRRFRPSPYTGLCCPAPITMCSLPANIHLDLPVP